MEPNDPQTTARQDVEFQLLRARILINGDAMTRGLEWEKLYRGYRWHEANFWKEYANALTDGRLSGYIGRSDGSDEWGQWAIVRPRIEGGEFDHVIAAWSKAPE